MLDTLWQRQRGEIRLDGAAMYERDRGCARSQAAQKKADVARGEVVRRWGEKGLIALAMALTTARMYPTLKYALGHGRACSRVMVAGEPARFENPARLAA